MEHKDDTNPMDKQPRHMPGEGAQGIRAGDAAQHTGAGLDAAGTAQGTNAGQETAGTNAGQETTGTAQDTRDGQETAGTIQDIRAGQETAGTAQDTNAGQETAGTVQGTNAGQETAGTAQGARDGDAAQHAGAGLDAAGTAQYSDTGGAAQHSRRMKRGEVRPGSAWALVTGAGSGIGRCYALRLAALGYRLVIVGNNAAPLEAVAEEIRSAAEASASATGTGRAKIPAAGIPTAGTPAAGTPTAGTSAAGIPAEGTQAAGTQTAGTIKAPATPTHLPEVRVMPMDLARVGAAQELYDRTAAEGIGIDVVINNAGIFSFCDILATPAERIERIVLLHDLTVTQLCRLYAADMVRRGVRGHILNMSSYSLWMPFPGLALYSASKAYMRSFSVAFAKEVRECGIRVTAVCPAGVATDLYGLTPRWQRIGKRLGVLITPDNCARKGLRALWRGRRCIVPDWWNRAWIPLCKALPMWALRPIRRFTMRFQK